MTGSGATAWTAVGLFAGTNIDDLVVLTALFLAARTTGRPRPHQIWIGQYLGIAALVVGSLAVALGLAVVPEGRVGWLGLVPLTLGLTGLRSAARAGPDDVDPPPVATGVVAVAGVTLANGGDNIAAYTPAFRALGAGSIVIVLAVFAIGVALWCLVAARLGSHRAAVAVADRWGVWLVPIVFVVLGVVILTTADPFRRLVPW
jgi:cadmium resistance protein CadD (predicted permease)